MKIKQDKELLGKIKQYNSFMNSMKSVSTPVVVSEYKENHKTSLYTKKELISDVPFGKTSLTCEVRNGDNKDCTFQIISDAFCSRVVFRYDTGGGTHKNDAPGIPLAEQSVTVPHFHKYDSNGYFLAYKTDILNDPKNSDPLFDIEFGFPYFCQEGNISADRNNELPEIKLMRDGFLPFPFDNEDPLEGISFLSSGK